MVCINRDNALEKGIQIHLMGDIYKRATNCVAWISKSCPLLDRTIDVVLRLSKTFERSRSSKITDRGRNSPLENATPWDFTSYFTTLV